MLTTSVKKTRSVMNILALIMILISVTATSALAETQIQEAPDWIGTPDSGSAWQIVSQKYNGRDQSNKKGYDLDKDGSNDVYYQKNVVSTGTENEFLVYLSITKKMTWDDLLAESDFGVTTSNKYHDAIGSLESSIVGNPSIIEPGKSTSGRNYQAVVTFTRGGKVVHTYKGWYHGTTPECSNGTGFIVLKNLGLNLIASTSVSLQNDGGGSGGQLSYTIDLDTMSKHNINFSLEDVVIDSVTDKMGEYITYEGVKNCDGTYDYSDSKKMLTWTPASNGVKGQQVRENGGLTGFYYNVHQLVYKVQLNVLQDGFNSCAQNMNSVVGDAESYRVNEKAVLSCHMADYSGSAEFQVPYVRGLLYNVEFQKIIEDSKVPVSGIQFTIVRKTDGLSFTQKVTSGEDGWTKFRNLPWGIYEIKETSFKDSGTLGSNYLDEGNLTKTYTIQVGKTINPDSLTPDHSSGHSVDQKSDVKNLLFTLEGKTVENTPNQAKITVVKYVNEYDKISSDLKKQKYTVHTSSSGDLDVYTKPGSQQTDLDTLDEKSELGHQESVTYNVIVPKEGGQIRIEETIPEEIRDKMVFDSVDVQANSGSTALGEVKETTQGCELNVLPGNDITIVITNSPVATVSVRKVIDNYRAELSDDAFVVQAKNLSDKGTPVDAEMVLKHQETSGIIKITKATTLEISEILPKEYAFSGITLSGGGTLNGNKVSVKPGENIVVTVHNTYSAEPYFHSSDSIKNIFKND